MEYAIQVARLAGGCYPIIALCAKAAFLMVKRPCEILSLRFDQITDDGIHFIAAKRKAGQAKIKGLILWLDELRKVIDEVRQVKRNHDRLGVYVFGNLAGEIYTRSGWGTNWGKLMKRSEVAAKREGREFVRFTLMDCRPAGVTGKKARGDLGTQDATLYRDSRMIDRIYDRRSARIAKPVR